MLLKKAVIHTHHIFSHFTNGLFPVSSVMITIFLVTLDTSYETASFYCLIFGALAIPIVYGSGFYDWRTRFKGRHTMIFDHKSVLGIILLLLTVIAICWRLADNNIMVGISTWKWGYLALNYSITGLVSYLGYLGGKFV